MNKKFQLFLIPILVMMLFGCEKKIPVPDQQPSNPAGDSRYLLVGNEGALGTNTASISLIDLKNNTVQNNVFKNKNGQALGDVLQSIERIGDSYYFMMNNSDKIVVTDTNFIKKTEIPGIVSPRYMKAISASRAYVTSLFNDKIYIIDLSSNTKISEIIMAKNWTEQMVLVGDGTGDFIYVCENDTLINYVTKIDVTTNKIVDKISIAGVSPSQIGITSDNHLWVLAGNNFFKKVSTLTEIDLNTKAIVKSFSFNQKYETGRMAIGPNDEKYIAVVNYTTNHYGVYKFLKDATSVPINFFVDKPASANFYGLAVDAKNGDVYISDTKGFSQAGDVNRYSSTGVLLNSWTTGLGPSSFYFVQ